MPKARDVEAQLHLLKERFVAALPKRVAALADAIGACENGAIPPDDLSRLFHSLAGTAGTYGLTAIASLAREGEETCESNGANAETFDYLRTLVVSMDGEMQQREDKPPAARLVTPLDEGRILCVEDDPDQGRFIRAILEPAGYEVRVLGDPKELDATLASFRPDLILMDIVLPGTTGVELAQAIRRDAASATVPIVFLTQRRRVESRIEAAAAGGDDYLTKPVDPELLRSIIAARLKGARAVRLLIDRDGLTGVLTHAAFMRRAEVEMARARRNQSALAMVMLDLDHFKSINDTHGHPAGDRVLAAFGSLLAAGVRLGDDVGRYGGEEFSLLLRDIGTGDVRRLVTRLLDEFSSVPFRGARGGGAFHVTFSAGIAALERGWDLYEWTRHADDALYSAKHHGRARVEAA